MSRSRPRSPCGPRSIAPGGSSIDEVDEPRRHRFPALDGADRVVARNRALREVRGSLFPAIHTLVFTSIARSRGLPVVQRAAGAPSRFCTEAIARSTPAEPAGSLPLPTRQVFEHLHVQDG
jgi:hypothetical protein